MQYMEMLIILFKNKNREGYKHKIKNSDYFKETLIEKWTMNAIPYLSSSVKFQGRGFWTGLAEV